MTRLANGFAEVDRLKFKNEMNQICFEFQNFLYFT